MFDTDRISYSRLQIISALTVFISSIIYSPLSNAEQNTSPIYVSVALNGDDSLTQKLSSLIKSGINLNNNIHLVEDKSDMYYNISSDSNVDLDILSGKEVIIYNVYLRKDGIIKGHIVGVCFEKKMIKCSKDILDKFISIMEINR
ncbi:hypothetical protein [Sphingopyxis granuli]|uniref:hypothetical protein n=1 Tax=Sphingopyxis granuli TaxID=267128 RepID=UPI0011DFCDD8|nr:hypothetical protein [Sphingopyxis granuli]